MINNKSGKKKLKKEFYHTVKYSIIDEKFNVFYSEQDNEVELITLKELRREFTNISHLKILESMDLKTGEKYFIQISAFLDPVIFLGTEEKFDLMLFWNKKRPVMKSQVFDNSIFLL